MSQERSVFTYAEATELLLGWGIKGIQDRLKDDRKNLVDEIIQVIFEKVPFQCVTLMACAVEERRQPSYDEIKASCVSMVGGVCYEIAPFTYRLLNALGFSVQILGSNVTSKMNTANDHVVLLLRGLEKTNDVHLVDCGSAYPMFRAISLNFPEESPVFRDSFLEYKYVRHEGKILRMHGEGDRMKVGNPSKESDDFCLGRWRCVYSFSADLALSGQEKPVDDAYRVVAAGKTILTSSPRAVWFPRKRAFVIVNNKLIVEKENWELVTTVLDSDEEILEAYQEHFPQLKQDAVRCALKEWRRFSN